MQNPNNSDLKQKSKENFKSFSYTSFKSMEWPRNTNRGRLQEVLPDYDSQGKVHAIINFSESTHMVQTERAFGTLRVSDYPYKLHSPPPLVNVLQGGNVDNVPHFSPVMAYIGSPKKPGEFSPKEGRSLNPLARVKRSPFSRDDDYSSADESDDDYKGYANYKDGDDWNTRYEGSYSPRAVRPNHVYDADYGKGSPKGNPNSTAFSSSNNRVSPRQSTPEDDYIQSQRANWRSSLESGGQPHYRSISPRRKDKQYERPTGHSPLISTVPESDNTYVSQFGPTNGGHPHYNSTSPKKDKQYERPIGNSPLIRTVPESDNTYVSQFGPTSGGHPHYNSTSPKTDKQYERPIGHSPPIRTKPESDTTYVSQAPKAVTMFSRNYERPMPRRDGRQQVIDSREAAKHGEPPKGQIYKEEYRGTIDCREAAVRYNGIFVPSKSSV